MCSLVGVLTPCGAYPLPIVMWTYGAYPSVHLVKTKAFWPLERGYHVGIYLLSADNLIMESYQIQSIWVSLSVKGGTGDFPLG